MKRPHRVTRDQRDALILHTAERRRLDYPTLRRHVLARGSLVLPDTTQLRRDDTTWYHTPPKEAQS